MEASDEYKATFIKKMAPKYAADIDRYDAEFGERAIASLGRRTSAFGLRKGRGLQTDSSNFLNPSNPAMHPIAAALPPMGGGWIYIHPYHNHPTNRDSDSMFYKPMGGSFLPA